MIKLTAKIRKELGKKTRTLRTAGKVPAVVYGPGEKNASLEIDAKELQKVFKETGGNSLIELNVEGEKEKRLVLIHEVQRDSITGDLMHVDFFQASLKEEVEVKVPITIVGVSLAVKDLGGTLVKNISEIHIKALPQNLPHEIIVSIDGLNTFEDHILIKDLILPEGAKTIAKPDEIVVSVAQPAKVEEELAEEIEEKVEDIEKVEKEKKTEDVVEEVPEKK